MYRNIYGFYLFLAIYRRFECMILPESPPNSAYNRSYLASLINICFGRTKYCRENIGFIFKSSIFIAVFIHKYIKPYKNNTIFEL